MFGEQKSRWLVPLLLGSLILILDQISKYWIVQTLGPHPLWKSIDLAGDWLRLVYSQNTGVAFSLFQGLSPYLTVVATIITIGAMYVYWFYLPNTRLIVQVCLGLIIGGAIGNLVDRIRLNYVVDFIQVGWWPVFNVADSAISVGAGLLAVYLLFYDNVEPELPTPRDDDLLNELLSHNPSDNQPRSTEPESQTGRMS